MNHLARVALTLASLAIVFVSTRAFPNGAPPGTCDSMTPSHNSTPGRTSPPPFGITVNTSNCYTPGIPIRVTIHSNDHATPFEGFFMQARKDGEETASYGVFNAAGARKLAIVNCFEATNNAITHNTRIKETHSNFTWTAPTSLTGSVVLTTTVVKEFDEFWVKSVTVTLTPCHDHGASSASTMYSFAALVASVQIFTLVT